MSKKLLLYSAGLLMATAAQASVPVDFSKIEFWAGEGPNQAALLIVNDDDASDPNGYVWGYRWKDGETPTGEDMFKAICRQSDNLVLLTQFTGMYGATVCGIGYSPEGEVDKLIENIYFDFDMAKDYEFVNFDYYSTNTLFGQTQAPGDETPALCQAAIDEARTSGRHYIQHPIDAKTYGYPAYDYDCWFLHDEGLDYGWWSSAWYTGYWSYWLASEGSDDWGYSGVGFTGRSLSNGAIDAWSFTKFPEAQIGGAGSGSTPPSDPSKIVYIAESHWKEDPDAGQTKVNDLLTNDTNGMAIYYNLNGAKVAESKSASMPTLPAGIYIRVANGKTQKIIIK